MRVHAWAATFIILFFAIVLWRIQHTNLSLDEAHTAWIIRDDIRQPDSLGEWIRATGASLKSTFERARLTASVPLHYLLLDGWSRLTGESELALRYPVALLDMMILAGGYRIGTQFFNRRIGFIALSILGIGGYVMLYGHDLSLWSVKPDWRETVMRVATTRTTSETGLMLVPPDHPLTYYERHYPFADGITINFGWRPFTAQEVQNVAAYLQNNSSTWAFLDMQLSQSWAALATLARGRGVGYRESVAGTIFYRFDAASEERLTFQFGHANPVPVMWDYRTYAVGDVICPDDFSLNNTPYAVEMSLMRETTDLIIPTDDCLTVPDAVGDLYVRLSLLDPAGQRLPVVEQGHEWGDFLIVGTVIQPSD